jgi:hypothetical protein
MWSVSRCGPEDTLVADVELGLLAPEPKLSPVHAVFQPTARDLLHGVIAVSGQGAPTYTWRPVPPKDNPGCNHFAPVPGSSNEAVWHHANMDGCPRNAIQRLGTVYVTVTTADWVCTQWFFGTLTRVGSSAQICKRR